MPGPGTGPRSGGSETLRKAIQFTQLLQFINIPRQYIEYFSLTFWRASVFAALMLRMFQNSTLGCNKLGSKREKQRENGNNYLTLQRGVTGTARMLHALTHSSISRQVREQM